MSDSSSSSSSEDSDSSNNGHNEVDMEAMLEEWDAKETSEHYDDGDASSDSEDGDEGDDEDAEARLAALKRSMATAGGDSDESESAVSAAASEESESEEEEAEEEEVSEEEVEEEVEISEEEESEDEAEEEVEEEEEVEAAAPVEDDDDGEVIDDGDITDTLKKKPKKKKDKVKVKKLSEEIDPNDAEAVEMAKLLGDWGVDDDDDADDDDDDDDDDEESDASEREVVLDDGVIDHIVLAAPDLDEAMSNFEKMTGIAPKVAGTINGLGIKCARISFNDSSYLEIIAPDPKGPGPIGNLIKSRGIKELTPFHFAIRSSKAEELKTDVKQFGYVPDHITMFGGTKDGVPKKWEMLFLYGHKLGGICPFIINWSNTDHPCATLPVVGKLKKFSVRAPADDPVHQLLEHLNVSGINIEEGASKMSFQLSTPEGTVKFAAKKAVGFKFPGFEDDNPDVDEMDVMEDDNEEIDFEAPAAPDLIETGDYEEYEALPPPSY